ncbi:MAG: glycosyltransferase [Weeksellaceae bacterium]|nr:glycosyltransferase [Bacteroidota bacterium]MCG2779514.1 glycosyltransferase [Weeksellaceae bacterium]
MEISVIIPVYNAEHYVANAVESALQFSEVHEIILVEDKSPDNALDICKQLAEKYGRVKLFRHPDGENHGAGASRNLGMEKSTGDFIAFLDADDFYLPNRFDAEKQLLGNPLVDGIYGALGTHYYTQKAKEQNFPIYGERLVTVYKNHSPQEVFRGLLGMNGSFGLIHLDTLTVRKSALEKLNPWMKTHLRLHQDTEFLFRLSYYCNLYPGILDQPIAVRGIHEENRITRVDSGKIKPASTKVLLWKEMEKWAENNADLPQDIKIHIRRMHRSFKIANASSIKKWGMIVKYFMLDFPSIRSGLYNINFRKNLF